MKKYLVQILLIAFHVSLAQNNSNIIDVPHGSSLLNDGVINVNAWDAANKLKVNGGGEIYLLHDEKYLYLGFRGIYEPWSHLYINNRSNVYVLHVTASMGRVIYNMGHYGSWHPDRRFNWKMRNSDYGNNKNIEARKFLDEEGWITSINSGSDKKELVFKISLESLDVKKLHIAFVYGKKENLYLFWPQTLNDDTLKPEIFTGYNPTNLRFDFSKWALLQLRD